MTGSADFRLHSPELGTEYSVFLDPETGKRGALLLVLDGDDQFDAARTAARGLRASGRLPPVHLVGIGYGGGYRSPVNRRARDYTPTRAASEPAETGGADAFLEFIRARLLPALAERMEFAREDIGVGGHSLGSLLGAYALVRREPLFARYLISAPALWWDDQSIFGMIRSEPAGEEVPLGDARPAAPPAHGMGAADSAAAPLPRAFLCIGAEDTPSMNAELDQFEGLLRAGRLGPVTFTSRRFAGRNHFDVLTDAYSEGLAWLYA